MSKVGGYKREDGKWVKPATYSPASLQPLLDAQRRAPSWLGMHVLWRTRGSPTGIHEATSLP